MADTVQVMMEKMIPELEDLQERKLFTKDEIHQIVEKRRDFEYMMKRIPLRKIDGLRYIEYELNLDALRKKRKERSGLQKISLSDTAGIKRVHNIFERLIYKHRGSLDLWLQYIAFCKSEGSGRVLSHVFSRALQSHPRSPEIWIEAASYEFSTNLSVDSARVLMQRAIRINKQCQRLWHEYFRLELLYIQKLVVRREVLKLDEKKAAPAPVDTSGTILIDELAEEEQESSKSDTNQLQKDTEKQQARAVILNGAIARIVYQNAIATIPDDVTFRLKFIEICDLFDDRFVELSQFILDSCLQDFPTSEQVHAAQALRFLAVKTENVLEAEQQTIQTFESCIEQLKTITMKETFVEWIVTRLSSAEKTASLVKYAKTKLKEMAFDKDSTSITIAIRYVDLVHRTEGTACALDVIKELIAQCHSQSAGLWLLHSQLVLHHSTTAEDHDEKRSAPKRRRTNATGASRATSDESKSGLEASLAILQEAITKLDSGDYDGIFAVHNRLLQLILGDANCAASKIEQAYKAALSAQLIGSPHWQTLRHEFIAWAFTAYPPEKVRVLYQNFLQGQLLPTDATYHFLLLCVEVETSMISSDMSVPQVRRLFEKLVDLFGHSQEDVWLTYLQFFSDNGMFNDAIKVHQRALRIWKDSIRLTQLSLTSV